MTIKYDVTKSYNSGAEIKVTLESVMEYIKGERLTLDHVVIRNEEPIVVTAKPRKDNYRNYVYVDNYGVPIDFPVGRDKNIPAIEMVYHPS